MPAAASASVNAASLHSRVAYRSVATTQAMNSVARNSPVNENRK